MVALCNNPYKLPKVCARTDVSKRLYSLVYSILHEVGQAFFVCGYLEERCTCSQSAKVEFLKLPLCVCINARVPNRNISHLSHFVLSKHEVKLAPQLACEVETLEYILLLCGSEIEKI